MKIWIVIGSFMAGLSVLIGAFGAHGLKSKLNPMDLEIFETGVKYQMYHFFNDHDYSIFILSYLYKHMDKIYYVIFDLCSELCSNGMV